MDIRRDAVLSPCGQYRYRLTRTWDDRCRHLLFIMLNPSTADALVDDATIRVCMGRAMRMVCGGITVVNLFAYRATQPHEMLLAADPVGPDNNEHILRALSEEPKRVIAAWGANGGHRGRAASVKQLCGLHRTPLYCLGTTQDGSPRHPLRIAYSVEPQVWAPRP